MCDKGILPTLLNVTTNPKIKNRDGVFATDKDNRAGMNITSFGLCAMAGICQLNMALSGQELFWINTVPKIKIKGQKPLYEASKCICPLGGIISSLHSGQM